ncbi:MAG: dihydroneopterin aldolase [Gammaproteobacteria bacterium]
MSIVLFQRKGRGRSSADQLCYHRATFAEGRCLPMDIVYLRDLRVDALIGVWAWERRIRQTLIMDIELGTDCSRAGASDDIADTVDYKAVTDRIIEATRASGFKLIEALAEHLAQTVLNEFDVRWIRININKRGVLREVRDVGIVIERGERV